MAACELHVLESIYYKVFEASPYAKIVVDDESSIILCNAQAELLFGYDRVDLLGKPVSVLVPEDKREAHNRGLREFFKRPQIMAGANLRHIPGLKRNGEVITISVRVAPIVVPNGGLFAIAVIGLEDG